MAQDDALIDMVWAFITSRTDAIRRQVIEADREKLLSDAADEVLVDLLAQFQHDPNAMSQLQGTRDLLARCRADGLDAVFGTPPQPKENVLPELWAQLKRVESQKDMDHLLVNHPEFLSTIQRFVEKLQQLQPFLNEIALLSEPTDMPRRIELCRHALTLVSREQDWLLWAILQGELAASLSQNPVDNHSENMELALRHAQQVLQVYTQHGYSDGLAMAHVNLATVYANRGKGGRAENLEQSIHHLHQALQIYSRDENPYEWGMAQNNLGIAYMQRMSGDRTDNLERALHHCRQALKVRTRKQFPVEWAVTQHNLGNAYARRLRGNRAENLEKAVSHCTQAREIYIRQDVLHSGYLSQGSPLAGLQRDLANIYLERTQGDHADNIELAISYCQSALEVYTRFDFPYEWATIQETLAAAYTSRVQGNQSENLEWAIHHSQQALQIYTPQDYPGKWAAVQHILAGIYHVREQGNQSENLEQAIHHYEQALEVQRPETLPQQCRDTAYGLGRLLYDAERYVEARSAFTTAHQAVEHLRGELQRDATKRALAEENIDLYARLVYCCLLEDDIEAAFVYAVAGKGRAFVDLLASARFDLDAAGADDPELAANIAQARQLRQQIDALFSRLTGDRPGPDSSADNSDVDGETRQAQIQRVQDLQAQETQLWQDLTYKYPALTATQQVPALSVADVRSLAEELDVSLVEFYRHAAGWSAFVVTGAGVQHVPLPLLDDTLLLRMLKWLICIEMEQRGPLTYKPLALWYDAIVAPLRPYLAADKRLILAPFGALHLLPLAAACDPESGRYLGEEYCLAFAPSLAALHISLQQARRDDQTGQQDATLERLLNVAYPGHPDSDHYLPNVLPEAQMVARHFSQVESLYEDDATPTAVVAQARDLQPHVAHIGCHGLFNWENPEQSGLMLAGGWLTVQRIATELDLQQTRLAVLSACVTGRPVLSAGEEYTGLLQAVMTAGAHTVIASLWSVHDAATRALFEHFYSLLHAGLTPADALQQAAQAVQTNSESNWSHPFYWAAFQANGLAYGLPGQAFAERSVEWDHLRDRQMALLVQEAQPVPMRGERTMDPQELILSAELLLEQMSDEPDEVLAVLEPTAQRELLTELDALVARSAQIESDADLLDVASAVHMLVLQNGALRALIMDPNVSGDTRTVSLAVHQDAARNNQWVQIHAPQIRNAMRECREQLQQTLAAADPGQAGVVPPTSQDRDDHE